MPHHRHRLLCLCLLFGGALCPVPALAQSNGIAVDRFVPAPGPGSFLQVEDAALPLCRQLLFTSALWAVTRPLVLLGEVPVRERASLDLGGELGIGRRVAVGLGWPLVLWQQGARMGAPLGATEVGDVRLRVKGLLWQSSGAAGAAQVALAGGLELTLPGGGQGDFAASASPTFASRLMLSFRWAFLAAAVNATARFMAPQQLDEVSLGHHLEWGAGLRAALPGAPMSVIAEATGLVRVGGAAPAYPVELRGALRLLLRRVAIDLGGGGGVGDAALSAQWRALLLVRGVVAGRSGNDRTAQIGY